LAITNSQWHSYNKHIPTLPGQQLKAQFLRTIPDSATLAGTNNLW